MRFRQGERQGEGGLLAVDSMRDQTESLGKSQNTQEELAEAGNEGSQF